MKEKKKNKFLRSIFIIVSIFVALLLLSYIVFTWQAVQL